MMKSEETQEINRRLKSINDKILAGAGGKKGRSRNVRGKEQNVNQQTIFDEIDRFETVSNRIGGSSIADQVIQESLGTIGLVAEQLDNPDLSPTERKNLVGYLDVAQQQLDMHDTTGMSGDDKKAYQKLVVEVEAEISNFRDLSQEGTRRYDQTKSFIEERSADATSLLIGVLTKNPALMIAHNMFAGYRQNKKDASKKQQDHFNEGLRQRKKTLEQQKTAIKDGNDIVEKSTVDFDIDSPDPIDMGGSSSVVDSDEKLDEIIEHTKATAEQVSKLVAHSPEGAVSENTESIIVHAEETSEKLSALVRTTEIDNAHDKNKDRINRENQIEDDRKDKGSMVVGKKKKGALKALRGADEDDDFSLLDAAMVGIGVGGAGALGGLLKKGKGILKLMTSFAGLMKVGSMILKPLMLVIRALGPVGLVITGILAVFDGFMNVFEKWNETEGQNLPDRLLTAANDFMYGIIDAFIGIFAEDGEKWRKNLVRGVTEFFENIRDWLSDQITSILDTVQDWFAGTFAGKLLGVDTAEEKMSASESRQRQRGVDSIVENNEQVYERGVFSKLIKGGDIALKEDADLSTMHSNNLNDLYTDPRINNDDKDIIKAELIKRGDLTIERNVKAQSNVYNQETIGDTSQDYVQQVIPSMQNAQNKMTTLSNSIINDQSANLNPQTNNQAPVINNITNNRQSTINRQQVVPDTAPRGDTVRAFGIYGQ